MTLSISSATYLSQKLALTLPSGSEGVVPTRLSASLVTPTDDSLTLSSQNHGYLLLRDTITEHSNMVAVVQLTQTDLDNLASYLTDIQTRLATMAQLGDDAPERAALQAEVTRLEQDMSDYIGSRVADTPEVIGNTLAQGSMQQRYFETLDLGTALPDLDTSEIAVLEVDIGRVLMAAHPSDGCPLCQMSAGGTDVGLVPLESTSNSGSNTGAQATVLSTEAYIEALRMSYQWDLSSGETLSYSYYDGSVPYVGYPAGGVNPASAAYSIAAYASALDAAYADWDAVSALNFEKVVESGTTVGELRNAYTDSSQTPLGSAAYAFGPGGSSVNGDIWFDQTQSSNQSFTVGSYGYLTALHEIGHALGLSHPFDGSSSTGVNLSSSLDYMRNTIMSYTSTDRNYQLFVTPSGSGVSYGLNNPVYASTPMIYDVATIEYFYGVSTTTNTGDTTYTWADAPVVIETLVDSGGKDTIDASNQTRSNIIDLTPGSFSSIGYWSRTDRLAYYQNLYGSTAATAISSFLAANDTGPFGDILYTGEDNVGIAYSAIIENAIGGQADDILTGNSADNLLEGNAGNDTIFGGAGNDNLRGEDGNDFLDGGEGSDTVDYSDKTQSVVIDLSQPTYAPQSYILDGTGQNIVEQKNISSLPTASSARTYAAWVKYDPSESDGGTLIAHGTVNPGTFNHRSALMLVKNPVFSQDPVILLDFQVEFVKTVGIPNVFDDGEWHLITATFDPNEADLGTRIYVDGSAIQVLAGNNGFNKTSVDTINTIDNAATYGYEYGWTNGYTDTNKKVHFFEGELSNTFVWNRALTSAEIEKVYREITPSSDLSLGFVTSAYGGLTDIGHMVTVGGAQEDLVQNIENIVGGQANDTLTGNSEANTLIGGAGDDILYGGSTSRATTLGFTADPFPNGITINIAGLLSVALTGGSTGNDVAEQVRVALAADVRFSNFQIERTDNTLLIVAPAGDAVPILFSQFDMGGVNIDCTINAPSGMVNGVWYGENPYESILKQYGDRISGGVGNDTIDGGTGDNTAIFSRNFSDYTISSSAGTTTVRAITGPDGTDTLTNIRYLEFADLTWDLTTSTAAQVSGGSSGGSSSSSSSSSGNSTYVGRRKTQGTAQPSGPILVATGAKSSSILNTSPANQIVGSKGNDQLVGSESDDLIEAGAGDDVVTAGAGNDLIVGGNGEGDDLYIGGEGSDTVRYSSAKAGITVNLQLGSARSTLSGDAANIGVDTLREIENVIGGHHDDLLIGDAADNQIAGNGGNDIIEGGAGNDTAVFQGAKNSYTIKQADGGYLVTAANGDVVRLSNIEFLQFSDGVYRIALSTSSSSTALGQPHVGGISLRTQADASAAINTIDTALTYINRQRSALGTIMNVLDARARVLAAEKTNTYAARSKILDTDYAFETAMMARQMIIAQAGRAMLAMANQSGQQVLSLLR